MAEFHTTAGISFHLDNIIKDARDRIILISPYLKITDRLRERLEEQNRFKLDIRVIYGKSELNPEESNWLTSMESIRVSFCKDLHAKCYINEKEALITSMNMYEYSQQNNHEMGILIKKSEDEELYEKILAEALRIERASDTVRVIVTRIEDEPISQPTPVAQKVESPTRRKPSQPVPESGFCIRCRTAITLSPSSPYCSNDYRIWNRYKNAEYGERYCHICGDETSTSMAKPACLSCYRKHKNTLQFAPSAPIGDDFDDLPWPMDNDDDEVYDLPW